MRWAEMKEAKEQSLEEFLEIRRQNESAQELVRTRLVELGTSSCPERLQR